MNAHTQLRWRPSIMLCSNTFRFPCLSVLDGFYYILIILERTHTNKQQQQNASTRCGMPTLLLYAHTRMACCHTQRSLKIHLMLGLDYVTEHTVSPVWIRQRRNEATLHVTNCTQRLHFNNIFVFILTLKRASADRQLWLQKNSFESW